MYEMREDQQGNPQIKNGTGNWMTPVMMEDQFFTSSKAVAKKMKTSSGFVSTALSNGGKVKGKEVRRATVEEIQKNVKVKESDPPLVYRVRDGQVEIRGETGHWGKMAVYQQGLFTIPELAEELEVSESSIYGALRKGGDEDVQPATAEDMPEEAIRVHQPSKPGKKKNKKKKDKKQAPAPQTHHRFVGVRWPNGAVDIRFADGHTFMSRDNGSDVPTEVLKETKWLLGA